MGAPNGDRFVLHVLPTPIVTGAGPRRNRKSAPRRTFRAASGKGLLLGDFQPAAAEVEVLVAVGAGGAVDVGVQPVDDVAALALVLDEAGLAQDAEVVRHLDDGAPEQGGQLADVARPRAEALDDAQPLGVGE